MNQEQEARLQAPYARRTPDRTYGRRAGLRELPGPKRVHQDPVKAWIRFPDCAELLDGEVYAWMARAVELTWRNGLMTYRTWVWSPAVTRRENLMNRNLK